MALRAWAAAVSSRDVDAVLSLYENEGVLLGTLDQPATGARRGHKQIRPYFDRFLARDAIDVEFLSRSVKELDLQRASDNCVIHSSYYSFRLTNKGAQQAWMVRAKFTFIFHKGPDGLMKILTHNSGLVPAVPKAAVKSATAER